VYVSEGTGQSLLTKKFATYFPTATLQYKVVTLSNDRECGNFDVK
jgi:hypothetical protein